MNDVMVTVTGNAGNTPVLHTAKGAAGTEWTMFRIASTRRIRAADGGWTDGPTLWFTVKAWRTAALNVVASVRKGDPVVVSGRLELDEWETAEGVQRMGLVVNASVVGVDATRGRVAFARVVHHPSVPDGAPADLVDAAAGGDAGLVQVAPGEGDPFGVETEVSGDGHRELVTA